MALDRRLGPFPNRPVAITLRLLSFADVDSAIVLSVKPTPWAVAAYVNATLLALWGCRSLASELHAIQPSISRLTVGEGEDADRPIRGFDSIVGPLGLTTAMTFIGVGLSVPQFGWRVALLSAPISFLFELPLLTYFWTYLSLLVGLDRLGHHRLALDPTPGDRTLGLRPVGGIAFTGFWVFSAGLAPILIVSASSIVFLVLNLAFFLAGVGLFLLSLSRLHSQMAAAKQRHLELARRLYAEAYEPLEHAPTVRTLQEQTPLLSAAEALEKRSSTIQEWPFDEALTGRIAIVVTTVVATVVARIILDALGF